MGFHLQGIVGVGAPVTELKLRALGESSTALKGRGVGYRRVSLCGCHGGNGCSDLVFFRKSGRLMVQRRCSATKGVHGTERLLVGVVGPSSGSCWQFNSIR